MPAKKGKPGPKQRDDSRQRAQPIMFRLVDLWPEFQRRLDRGPNRAQVARRDLGRYYSLTASTLRAMKFDTADMQRVIEYLINSDAPVKIEPAAALRGMVEQAVKDTGAKSMQNLAPAEAVAVIDLISQADTAAEAIDRLAEICNP